MQLIFYYFLIEKLRFVDAHAVGRINAIVKFMFNVENCVAN